jgi:hypothetical protein
LTVLAAIRSSWRILCPNRGSFEGRSVVNGRDVFRRARGGCRRRSVRGTVAGKAASCSRMRRSAGAVATAPGMGLYARGRPPRRQQWQGWLPTGLTPQPNPARSRESKSRVQPAPPSRAQRVSRTGVGGAASRGWHRPRRIVPHSGGDGFPPRELVRQDRGASPRRMMAPLCYGQSIKCPYPRTGSGVRARNALELGGACSRAARTLERGGARSRETFPLERG